MPVVYRTDGSHVVGHLTSAIVDRQHVALAASTIRSGSAAGPASTIWAR